MLKWKRVMNIYHACCHLPLLHCVSLVKFLYNLLSLPPPINVYKTICFSEWRLKLYEYCELANPIKSPKTTQNVIYFYWILPNRPPWLTYCANSINVAAVGGTFYFYLYAK